MNRFLYYVQLVALGAAIVASVIVLIGQGTAMDKLKLATGYALLIFLFFLAMALLLQILEGKIDLSQLIEELDGGASMSRFQLLVFTFVIGFSLFLIVAESGSFPKIPNEVLLLLGISTSTYAVSKGIQVSGMPAEEPSEPEPQEPAQPPKAKPTAAGQ